MLSGFSWMTVIFTIVVVVLVTALFSPLIVRSRPVAPLTEALNNIRQIGLGLLEFSDEYGKYPDASTIPLLKKKTNSDLDLGDQSSNQLFRQLIANGLKFEKPFWVSSALSPKRKPDDITTPGKALAPGECAFGYIMGLSPEGDPATPIVLTPFVPGTDRFDPKPFNGKAIVLRIDQSATAMQIDDEGRVMVDGKSILDPAQPWWMGKKPDLKLPEVP